FGRSFFKVTGSSILCKRRHLVLGPWVRRVPSAQAPLKTDQAVSNRRQGAKSGCWCHCDSWASQAAVIPAKAGIHLANLPKCAADRLDSRFRGNDRGFERDPIPNDATTQDCAEQFIIRNS